MQGEEVLQPHLRHHIEYHEGCSPAEEVAITALHRLWLVQLVLLCGISKSFTGRTNCSSDTLPKILDVLMHICIAHKQWHLFCRNNTWSISWSTDTCFVITVLVWRWYNLHVYSSE